MDRRTAIALAFALIVFAGFTALQAKYAPKPVRKPAADTTHAVGVTPAAGADTLRPASPGKSSIGSPAPVTPRVPETRYVIETPLYIARFTNRGARLESFELKRYSAAYGPSNFHAHPGLRPKRGQEVQAQDRVRLEGAPSFALDLGSGASFHSLGNTLFAARESLDATGAIRALTFTTTDSAGLRLRQTWRVRPDSYLLDLEIETLAVPAAWNLRDYSLGVRSWLQLTESDPQTDVRSIRAVSLVGKDLHRDAAAGLAGHDPKVHEGVAHWAGVQSHYFLALVAAAGAEGRAAVAAGWTQELPADRLAMMAPGTKPQVPGATGTLVMPLPPSGTGIQRFVTYFGPGDYFALAHESGSLGLERAVDMGWGWIVPLSKLLLQLLRGIDSVVHNFGVTILLLATLVRLALHPLNMSSMKSMRAMQRLQPEIERLRKKFENDAQALNTATMALYRENNVNPMGGCLPMLLQMPLFFALYAVINNAIDLRQAPFVAWIHDLSSPDLLLTVGPLPVIGSLPIRLLPLLMAGTGFLSQLLTPTDPRQAPTMYMMNIFMLFIFYNLPSGLVFYWTVMNLLTAVQQWLAVRGDSEAVVVPAVAGKGRKS